MDDAVASDNCGEVTIVSSRRPLAMLQATTARSHLHGHRRR